MRPKLLCRRAEHASLAVLMRRVILSMLPLAFTALAPGTAASQELRVASLGQPGAMSSTPQPAVQAIDRGPCDHPYDLAQANGGPSTCSWPATGTSGWNPAVEIAGGDTLELRLASAASAVTVTSTTNQDPRRTAPDGTTSSNELWFGPVGATATAEPGTWTVALPPQPPGRFYGADGGTFAVLATIDGQKHAYSLSLTTPRADVFGQPCGGRYFTSPGVSETSPCQASAGGKALPPGPSAHSPPPGPTASMATKLKLAVRHTKQLRSGVRITIQTTRSGALLIQGRMGRRTYAARRTVRSGTTAVTLRLARRARGRLTLRVQLRAGAEQTTVTKSTQLR